MTDHREDIREAAHRWTEAARFALAADRDELHTYAAQAVETEWEGVYVTPENAECEECGLPADEHWPAVGVDSDDYADGLAGLLLDADVLTAPDDRERWRVELSLTVGGPTVYVVADSRWSSVEFHHSWGRGVYSQTFPEVHDDPATWPDLHTVSLYGDAAAVWLDIAAQCAGADL